MDFWLPWVFFNLVALYGVIYLIVWVAARYKQLAVEDTCFEKIKEAREYSGENTSDILSLALDSLKRDWAKKYGMENGAKE